MMLEEGRGPRGGALEVRWSVGGEFRRRSFVWEVDLDLEEIIWAGPQNFSRIGAKTSKICVGFLNFGPIRAGSGCCGANFEVSKFGFATISAFGVKLVECGAIVVEIEAFAEDNPIICVIVAPKSKIFGFGDPGFIASHPILVE
ncbi:hypothetical protein L484_016165 [Morus notabilis]|uniref:Uncharacterized protein n=1 Tax=Morus notabilis TaxID=981085 RepID=W9QIR2_9ROSA|nr:hypothetical protein L484_016165 [Morus notabilis]